MIVETSQGPFTVREPTLEGAILLFRDLPMDVLRPVLTGGYSTEDDEAAGKRLLAELSERVREAPGWIVCVLRAVLTPTSAKPEERTILPEEVALRLTVVDAMKVLTAIAASGALTELLVLVKKGVGRWTQLQPSKASNGPATT